MKLSLRIKAVSDLKSVLEPVLVFWVREIKEHTSERFQGAITKHFETDLQAPGTEMKNQVNRVAPLQKYLAKAYDWEVEMTAKFWLYG